MPLPEIPGPGPADGMLNAAISSVIRREREIPVAENRKKRPEMLGRCPSGFLGIAAFINPPVILQAVDPSRSGHELPGAAGALAGKG